MAGNCFATSSSSRSLAHEQLDAVASEAGLRWAATMTNPMRIASARSKVGEDPAAIVEEVALDVWIDLESIFPRRMLALSEAEETEIRAALLELAADSARRTPAGPC